MSTPDPIPALNEVLARWECTTFHGHEEAIAALRAAITPLLASRDEAHRQETDALKLLINHADESLLKLNSNCAALSAQLAAAKAECERIKLLHEAALREIELKNETQMLFGRIADAAETHLRSLQAERDELAKVLSGGAGLIVSERAAHVSREGWTAGHDDEHTDGSLRVQAAINCCRSTDAHVEDALDRSPWTDARKPIIKQLIIAGSLIAAEIDRLNRIDAARQSAEAQEPKP